MTTKATPASAVPTAQPIVPATPALIELCRWHGTGLALPEAGKSERRRRDSEAAVDFRILDLASAGANEPAIDRRRELFGQALACWRGAALEEFAGALWADTIVLRLEQRRLEVLERRIDLDLTLGRARELIGELDDLVR